MQAGRLTSYYIVNSLLFKFSLRTLRLCGEKQVSNLGILGNLAHFRHCFWPSDIFFTVFSLRSLPAREISRLFYLGRLCG
jgi:hypothetical protein